jgi:nitrogen-specific signal transduction histidine kinase
MSGAEDVSLLGFLETPVLVGDPDGRIVYANPAFRRRFSEACDDPMGQPLAMVFGGGAREVVLKATAEVLQRGQSARLQIREGSAGYLGLASPIEAEDDRIGVVMVLLEEQSNEEYLTGLADEIGEPIAAATKALQTLSAGLDPKRSEEAYALVEQGLQSIDTAQKWLRELQVAIRGGKPKPGRFDVANALQRVVERFAQELSGRVEIETLLPPDLPRAAGTTAVFERVLSQLIRQRLDESRPGAPLVLMARVQGGDAARGVLVSLVDQPDASRREATGQPPESVLHGIESLGGESVCVEDSVAGRVTLLRLAIAEG